MERAPSKAGSNMSKDVGGAGGLARTVTEQSQVSSISTGSNMASSMEVKSMKISYDLAPAAFRRGTEACGIGRIKVWGGIEGGAVHAQCLLYL